MIRKNEGLQRTFIDTDYICDRLVPEADFYRKFREVVAPIIKDEHFEDMYCPDNGRPAIPPSLLARAIILQMHRNLSDREMEEACMYDIRIKHALGLEIDERPFDHSSLNDFRQRLLENGYEKVVFDKILSHLITEGLIDKNEMQRIDATHIIADIAVPTAIRLIRKTTFEVLKMLKQRRKDVWEKVAKEIDIRNYHRKSINKEIPWKPEERQHKNVLVKVVAEAQIVYGYSEKLRLGQGFTHRLNMLKEVLNQNVQSGEDGRVRLLQGKERPKDAIVSPVDPDARFGAKSATNRFVGYKANITETCESRFITNISATRGNTYDGDATISLISEQKRNHDLNPTKLIGDGAYGSGLNRHLVADYGVQLVAPVQERNHVQDIYPKRMFKFDEARNVITCPMGAESFKTTYNQKRCDTSYYFPRQVCEDCVNQDRCTTSMLGQRIITIGPWHKEVAEAEVYCKTRAYKKEIKMRCQIEATNSDMKNNLGMRRARVRGLEKVNLQCIFTAVAVNVKRWISNILEKLKPKNASTLPAGCG